jgi:hypothetical protein
MQKNKIVIKSALVRNKQESVGNKTFNKLKNVFLVKFNHVEDESSIPEKFIAYPSLLEFRTSPEKIKWKQKMQIEVKKQSS